MPAGTKKVNQEIIKRLNDQEEVNVVYQLMDELNRAYHPELVEAKIALAWLYDVKPDRDGHMTLGWARKESDLHRQLHGYDIIIGLNYDWWHDNQVSDSQRKALLDHELCHVKPVVDDDGSVRLDDLGNTVWYIRKHDLEEFGEVVRRHGMYKQNLETF